MPKTRTVSMCRKISTHRQRNGIRALGINAGDAGAIVRQVQEGFFFDHFAKFEKFSGLTREKLARFVAIPVRTMTRRQTTGRLQPEESDRVLRASRIFEMAVELFEGDISAARQWLLTAQPGLGGEIPLEFSSTDVGAREVENLIGRLELGVIS